MQGMKDYSLLAKKLETSAKIRQYDTAEEKEAWTLSHAFMDLEESFNKFTLVLLPKLLNEASSEAEITDLLGEIGEEFRHILYHIRDTKYYDYLFPVENFRKD